jgi:hypothetical protein
LDTQDRHWEALERTVAGNASSIASLKSTVSGIDSTAVQSEITKSLLSHLETRLSDVRSSTWERIDRVDAVLYTRVADLETAATSLESWRPGIERSLGVAHSSVEGLRLEVSRLSDRGQRAPIPLRPGVLGPYASTGERPTASRFTADGPRGHRQDNQRRKDGQGYVCDTPGVYFVLCREIYPNLGCSVKISISRSHLSPFIKLLVNVSLRLELFNLKKQPNLEPDKTFVS